MHRPPRPALHPRCGAPDGAPGNKRVDASRPDGPSQLLTLGGTEQLIFNAEVEVPILQAPMQLRGVLFLDAGNAFRLHDDYREKIDELRASWGFGFRLLTPMGLLRFEWGFPFITKPEDNISTFVFTVGNMF